MSTGPTTTADGPDERTPAPTGFWQRLRGDRSAPPRPWRVEGLDDGQEQQPRRRSGWLRFWWLWLVLLLVNWVVSSLLLGPPARERVSYTFFLTQVDAGNVQAITSTADTIEGAFKKKVSYTP